tara:strand:- start:397 stop:1413 length:1017 start_codon:yes stop_codon:yes gene_type:complete
MAKIPTIVHFGGFAASGGSALRDLLCEYSDAFVFPAEFRLLKEKNGLLDLENALFVSKSPDNIDLAIRDFVNLSNHLARVTTKFTRIGFSYDKYTNGIFSKSIDEFIDEITDYKYPLNTHNYDFRKNYVRSQIDRYASKIFPYSFFEQLAYMSYPEYDSFLGASRKLLRSIFESAYLHEGYKPEIIALHNSVNHFTQEHILKSAKYFDDFKMVIIDRDPRDIFLDFPHHRYLPKTKDLSIKAQAFVHFFKALRSELNLTKSKDNCLYLRFEDLVLDYELTLLKIEDFLNLKSDNHKLKNHYFSPNKSIKNIAKYKKKYLEYKLEFDYIESELNEFIYS